MSDSAAIQKWRKKLAFLQAEEAKAVDPAQKFKVAEDIAEAKAKLAELGVIPVGRPHASPPRSYATPPPPSSAATRNWRSSTPRGTIPAPTS